MTDIDMEIFLLKIRMHERNELGNQKKKITGRIVLEKNPDWIFYLKFFYLKQIYFHSTKIIFEIWRGNEFLWHISCYIMSY